MWWMLARNQCRSSRHCYHHDDGFYFSWWLQKKSHKNILLESFPVSIHKLFGFLDVVDDVAALKSMSLFPPSKSVSYLIVWSFCVGLMLIFLSNPFECWQDSKNSFSLSTETSDNLVKIETQKYSHQFDSFPCRNFVEPTFWSNFRPLLEEWFEFQNHPLVPQSTRKCSQHHQFAWWTCKHLSCCYLSIDLSTDKLVFRKFHLSYKVPLGNASHQSCNSKPSRSKVRYHQGSVQSIFRWLDKEFSQHPCQFLRGERKKKLWLVWVSGYWK